MPSGDAPLAHLTDEQLLLAYRTGRLDAFEILVRRYQEDLFRFLMRFVGSAAAADDLFQETFLQVHLSADTFDTDKRLKPWLFTIGANKARDYLRKNKRQHAAPLSAMVGQDGTGPTFLDLMEADLPPPETFAEDHETAAFVRQAIAELPDHLREILLMAYFHQIAYKEIAENLGVPLGTVKSRLHAAVAAFAKIWKTRFPETSATPD